MEDTLPLLAAIEVNGVFTTGAAGRAGVHRLVLQQMRRAGLITQVVRGVWSISPPADPADMHVLRTVAYLSRLTRRTAADSVSALLLHDLPVVEADLGLVHLVRAEAASTRLEKGYTLRTYRRDVITSDRHPLVTTPVPTVRPADATVAAGLTGHPVTALAAADAALHAGLFEPADLEAAVARVPRGTRGIGAVRNALRLADRRRESPGESFTALVCDLLDVPLIPQVDIGPWRVDFLIAGTRVILEFDGALKYTDRQVLVDEKTREDDLRARGYVVVRLMWRDLRQPTIARAKISRALALAA